MAPVAPLSYTSQFGYYGLRVNPTFDQVLRTVKKPLRIPVPDRRAKWYALSPFRSLIIDAEAKYHDQAEQLIQYRKSDAELPENAAFLGRRSPAGADPTFDQIHGHGEAMDTHRAQEAASQLVLADRSRRTEQNRSQVLSQMHGPNLGDPTIQAAFDELDQAQAYHTRPAARPPPIASYRLEPTRQWAAAGQPQVAGFTPFGELNLGEPQRVTAGKPKVGQASTYESVKDSVKDG